MTRFTIIALALAAASLAGCAAQVVSSSPRSVAVRAGDAYLDESMKLAEAECQKHGRHARLMERPSPRSGEFIFDCVL